MQHNASDTNSDVGNLCHVSETVNMLYLAVCQIEATMNDANSSVNTLTESFTQVANHTQEVRTQAQGITRVEEIENFNGDLAKTTDEIQDNISKAIQAFQFYDRVCQRIDHVARSLEKVSDILSDNENITNKDSWRTVQDQIKSSYTMEAERIMFEFIMRGGSVKEALEIYNHHFTNTEQDQDDDDEIELF